MNNEENKKEKLTLKEKLKDKREKAKLELIIYGIFFVIIIIFARVTSSNIPSNTDENNIKQDSFIYLLKNNYAYNIIVEINNDRYEYNGKVLGNNGSINIKTKDTTDSYFLMNKKYYILEDGNYILTTEEEVYPYIDYHYLNINTIKEYIELGEKELNTYKINVQDILLNNQSNEYITININEQNKNIIIDYTNLLKLTEKDIEKAIVSITYSNIDNIMSLEE